VIPKTYREPIMKQNLDCVSWDIPQEGMDEIAKLEMNLKFNKPTNVSFTSDRFLTRLLFLANHYLQYFEAENLYIFG
jgi:hypothetical protein